ncbi:MAG TPA: hypothetical protein VGA33_11400 [Thermoanaerobaculia bacterium]
MLRSVRLKKRVKVAALVAAVAIAAPASERLTAQRCHCSFAIPSGWQVVSNPKARVPPLRAAQSQQLAPCAFGLRPNGWPRVHGREDDRDFGEYAITIWVTHQSFRDAARDGFFERVDALRKEWHAPEALPHNKPTDWMVLGRQASRDDATWIRSAGWFGLRGTTTVGYYYRRPGTGYWGMDPAYRAVLSTGRWRTAIIMADNPVTESEFDAVVKSFRFE